MSLRRTISGSDPYLWRIKDWLPLLQFDKSEKTAITFHTGKRAVFKDGTYKYSLSGLSFSTEYLSIYNNLDYKPL
jgi:hypothetical protein